MYIQGWISEQRWFYKKANTTGIKIVFLYSCNAGQEVTLNAEKNHINMLAAKLFVLI